MTPSRYDDPAPLGIGLAWLVDGWPAKPARADGRGHDLPPCLPRKPAP